METRVDRSALSIVRTSTANYPFDHRHLHHSHDHLHHHDGHGHLSSRDPDHQGFESGHGRAYRSLSHDDRPYAGNSLGGEVGLWSDLDEENGHDGLGVGRGRHGQNRSAMRRREEYEPTEQR